MYKSKLMCNDGVEGKYVSRVFFSFPQVPVYIELYHYIILLHLVAVLGTMS